VLAAPSLSEAIGLVNLEAAACGTPTITTRATGLEDWENGGVGGFLVGPDPELRTALERVSRLSTDEYDARSRGSRDLVERRYSWAVVSTQWREAYLLAASRQAPSLA
jgi:glycosyltransferase involved in cell wall biosynthesis